MQTFGLETSAGALEMRVSSDLMDNHLIGEAVVIGRGVRTVRDSDGRAMAFVLEAGKLYVVLRSASSPTGWRRCDLTTHVGFVHSFDVAQIDLAGLVLAIVASPWPVNELDKRVLVSTAPLAPDSAAPHWDNMDRKWFERGEFAFEGIVESIRIGAGIEDDVPMAVASVRVGERIESYFVNLGAKDDTWTWRHLPRPKDAVGNLQLVGGVCDQKAGLFALYDTTAGQRLEFVNVPGPYGDIARWGLPLAAHATCLAVLPAATRSGRFGTNLYVAGDGIYAYDTARKSPPVAVVPRGTAPPIHALALSRDIDTVSLVAITTDGRALHTEGPYAAPETWAPPLEILGGVEEIALLRGLDANELFIAATDRSGYAYQDPKTKLWKSSTIQVHASTVVAFTTYTTRISVTDARHRPVIGRSFELRAETATHLVANGRAVLVYPFVGAEVKTDASGTIVVAIPVRDLSAPTLRLLEPGGREVAFRPTQAIEDALVNIKDLGAETLRDGSGERLVTRDVKSGTLQDTRDAMRDIVRAVSGPRAMLQSTPDDRVHVLGFVDDEVQLSVIGGAMLRGSGADWLPDWINARLVDAGNAFAWMAERIDEGARMAWRALRDGVEFLVEIGAKLVRFVIDAMEGALRAISWILEKGLGLDLTRLKRWLGIVFDWSEIQAVAHGLVERVHSGIQDLGARLPGFAANADQHIMSLRAKLPKPDPKLIPATFDQVTAKAQEYTAKFPKFAEAHDSPGTSWSFTHMVYNALPDLELTALVPGVGAAESIVRRLIEIWNGLGPSRAVIEADVRAVLDGSVDLPTAIAKLASDALFTFIEAFRGIVGTLVTVLEKALGELLAMIDTPVPMALFRGILGRDVSVLESFALFVSASTSISHRVLTGRPLVLSVAAAPGLLHAAQTDWPAILDQTFVWSSLAYDVLNGISMIASERPIGGLIVDVPRHAANVLRLIAGRPAGVWPETAGWRAWTAYVVGGSVDAVFWLVTVAQLVSPPGGHKLDKNDLAIISKLRGACGLAAGIGAFCFEVQSIKNDTPGSTTDFAKQDITARWMQIIAYLVSDVSAGLTPWIPPAERYLFGGALGGGVAASGINFTRTWVNEYNKHPHVNF